MKRYNQQIEDTYVNSRREGDQMRKRSIEQSSGQHRRNRYQDDKNLYHQRRQHFNREDDENVSERGYSSEEYPAHREQYQRAGYPDTYRAQSAGYISEYVGDDRGRIDFFQRFGGKMYEIRYSLNHGKGPKNYVRSDQRILEDIHERLTESQDVDSSDIDIRIEKGEVILEGNVADRRQKRLAEDIAESVSGVRQLENRLRIASSH